MIQSFKYVVFTCVAVVITFVLHEFAHWDTGQFLGYDMIMTLNTVSPAKGSYDTDWHYTLISFMGPITTLIQAFMVFLLIRYNHNKNFYPLLFVCFYIEVLAGVMNLINPNDLGRISMAFGLPLLTLPILFITLQGVLLFKTTKREGYDMKFVGLVFFSTILFSSIWILMNNAHHIILIGS